MTISSVQAALAGDVVPATDVATVTFNGTNEVTSQISWFGFPPVISSFTFSIPAGDTTGSAITFFTTSKAGLKGTPVTGTIVAYDPTNVVIQVIPAGGTTPEFYMVATPPSEAAGGITLGTGSADAGDYPITDFGTAGGYTAPTSTAVCFVEGTRIRTPRGEVAVDDLACGDEVDVLHAGFETSRRVKWIGYRELNMSAHRDPFLVQPIRVRRDAFAENVPSRDLLVSPDHAVFADGVLVPARLLVNGASIVRERRMLKIRYYHVELDRHSIVLSENLPTESYLDTGNRSFFQNGGQVVDMNPDLSTVSPSEMRDTLSCAPFVHEPDMVLPIWQRLADRAGQLGYGPRTSALTPDPVLRLCVNGREYKPVCVAGDVHSFMLPSGPQEVRLVSRAARPSDAQPWAGDQRLLGISVRRIRVRNGSEIVDLALDSPVFGRGWWGVEQANAQMWRWTNGDALLRLPEANGSSRLLELTISGMSAYPLDATAGSTPQAVAATA